MQMSAVQWFDKMRSYRSDCCCWPADWPPPGSATGCSCRRRRPATASLITLNRYATEPIPDVVLVGSSLTFRLKEEYFATPRLRNLALAGGSPVTGLEIVANQPRLPKIILVETNVLSRATDEVLVAQVFIEGKCRAIVFSPGQNCGGGLRKLAACTRNPCAGCCRACPVAPAAAQRFRQSRLCRSCGARGQYRRSDGCNADQRSTTPAVDRSARAKRCARAAFPASACAGIGKCRVRKNHRRNRSRPISRFRPLADDRRRAQRVAVGRRCSSG